MKKIGLLIVLLISLISCSNDDSKDVEAKITINDYYGKWTTFDEATFKNNPNIWYEYYIFNTDQTFTRSRVDKGVTTTLTGTFEFSTRDNRSDIILTYSAYTNMIYNCSTGFGGTSELLYIHNGKLNNSASMCDYSPIYQKVK